jgi:hypothetical protein
MKMEGIIAVVLAVAGGSRHDVVRWPAAQTPICG